MMKKYPHLSTSEVPRTQRAEPSFGLEHLRVEMSLWTGKGETSGPTASIFSREQQPRDLRAVIRGRGKVAVELRLDWAL